MTEKREEMRRWAGLALYGLAGLGVVVAGLALLAARDSLRRNAATGDTAGAALTISFVLIGLVPMILVALLFALWLVPPGRRRDAPEPEVVVSGSEPQHSPSIASFGLALAGIGVLIVTCVMLASALRSSHDDYGLRGFALVHLAIQDLMLFFPLLLLAAVLLWRARSLERRNRRW